MERRNNDWIVAVKKWCRLKEKWTESMGKKDTKICRIDESKVIDGEGER